MRCRGTFKGCRKRIDGCWRHGCVEETLNDTVGGGRYHFAASTHEIAGTHTHKVVDGVNTSGAVHTRVGLALVHVGRTQAIGKARGASAGEAIDKVVAGRTIQAGRRGALVDVGLAVDTDKARLARAQKEADTLGAGGTVDAGAASTLIDGVRVAGGAGCARRTQTDKTIDKVDAQTAVGARRALTLVDIVIAVFAGPSRFAVAMVVGKKIVAAG